MSKRSDAPALTEPPTLYSGKPLIVWYIFEFQIPYKQFVHCMTIERSLSLRHVINTNYRISSKSHCYIRTRICIVVFGANPSGRLNSHEVLDF